MAAPYYKQNLTVVPHHRVIIKYTDITEILLKVALNTINNHHHHFDFFNILLIIDPCISAINKNAQK
jgi:hypothetical protein